ncbi:hypothetical protein [Microbispora amethystogenes]|nr:hypothetical protein [Microbispora amethystogenes]
MNTGFGYFATHDAVRPDTLARLVEQRGHEALLFTEHTHIPVPPGGEPPKDARGGELPRRYRIRPQCSGLQDSVGKSANRAW